ncbi:MAG: portal protein, partial [Polynucleobacter sp.]
MADFKNPSDGSFFEEPTESDKELVEWIVTHTERWRTYRDTNFRDKWEEYERIFRGEWAAEDVTRSSERSRLVTPGAQQAVETRHAEIMEAIFGQGEYFDIDDDVRDVNGNQLDVSLIREQLMEDFSKDKVKKSIDQIVLMAEIYGTGIGEVTVKKEKEFIPTTQPIPGVTGQAAIGVIEQDRIGVKLTPINPKNFLWDPNGTTVADCMGVAIEKPVSFHKVVEGIEKGIYRKVEIKQESSQDDLEASLSSDDHYSDDQIVLMTYYGLVPREYLDQLENGDKEVVDLFPDDSAMDEYADLVEAVIVIANGSTLLKAEANPYMMKDRPVLTYQADTMPNRLPGRGTVEKAYNMQKAIDSQTRSYIDSLALTTAPMMAMDATRMPRGSKFEVKPGKAILVTGNPNEILTPFKFGNTDGGNAQAAQNFERMLLQATG